MKTALLTGAALLMAVSSGAFAQTQNTDVPSSHSAAPAATVPGHPGTMNSTQNGQAARSLSSTDNARAGMQANAGGMFTTVPSQADLSSKVVGLSVYNGQNTNIGTIKDIAYDANGVQAYIVAVGGFLGMGDHYVAVRPSAMNIAYDTASNKWRATMNTDEAQLKAAPEYKYSSNG